MLYVIQPARPRERIKRVFVRARASCLSNTSYLPEVSGDSVTSRRERRSIHGPGSTFHVPAGSTVLLKRLFGQRRLRSPCIPWSRAFFEPVVIYVYSENAIDVEHRTIMAKASPS